MAKFLRRAILASRFQLTACRVPPETLRIKCKFTNKLRLWLFEAQHWCIYCLNLHYDTNITLWGHLWTSLLNKEENEGIISLRHACSTTIFIISKSSFVNVLIFFYSKYLIFSLNKCYFFMRYDLNSKMV